MSKKIDRVLEGLSPDVTFPEPKPWTGQERIVPALPTDIDKVLRLVDASASPGSWEHALAAEVRRLQARVDQELANAAADCSALEAETDEWRGKALRLQAKLERVEAVAADWRDRRLWCATDLDAALRD